MSEKDSIKFTDQHIDKILDGKKQTTMRTVKKKNLYSVGDTLDVEHSGSLEVTIVDRRVIWFGKKRVAAFDENVEIFPNTAAKHDALAKLEGFEDVGEMIQWFENRNYNLPQPFFLYRINPNLHRIEEGEEEE